MAVADNVIKLNRDRIDRRLRTNNDEGEQVSIRELADQQHEADFVVGEIRRVMQQRGLRGEDFAVMYRTTAQSRVLEEAFRMSAIPYQIVGRSALLRTQGSQGCPGRIQAHRQPGR